MRNLSPINDNKDLTTKAYVDGCVSPKYEKPEGGIPKDDLAAAVQASLGRADSALQASDLNELNTAKHTHGNKELLDTYTQTEANLADAVAKKHEHTNGTVLDSITSAKATAWDAAEQNAKDYADTKLTWGTF